MAFRLMIIIWCLFHVPMTWAGRNAARGITLALVKEQLWGYLLVKCWTIQQGQKVVDFVTVPRPWEKNPKLMTAEKIMRLHRKQWSPLQQLNCLTELHVYGGCLLCPLYPLLVLRILAFLPFSFSQKFSYSYFVFG